MRCIVAALCAAAALPIVASFSVGPAARSCVTTPLATCNRWNKPRQTSSYNINSRHFGRGSRAGAMRRSAAAEDGDGPVNMDDSDDPVDAEIYASLRKRLEELEKSAPAIDTGNGSGLQPATPTTPRAREFTIGDNAFKAEGPVSAEDKKRSLAWLTVKSVGVISAALSFGTVALYWLAGEYFVHLGPREYPGSASRGASIERTVEGGGGEAATAAPRRTIGSSTSRDAFSFEGFPDAGGNNNAVPPDF